MSDFLTPDTLHKIDAYWHEESGAFGFAGEESAGATFLGRDGSVWTTGKDGKAAPLLPCPIP